MLFGHPGTFAIECHHEPIDNDRGQVFGRMAVTAGNHRLGHIDEPRCMLNVTAGHLAAVVDRLATLDEAAFHRLSDAELFQALDRALYADDDRSDDEVTADAERHARFDFLTNGGESFDHTKSFLVTQGDELRLVFRDRQDGFHAARFPRAAFTSAVEAFLHWLETEAAATAPSTGADS